tara:strand:+ start:1445 stop:1609 length:165 start_codon:yes stop_codon:yes gene_type:complete
MIRAFGPNLAMLFRSILRVSKTREVGKRYLEATKYRLESSPEINPVVLNNAGIK